jgi:hypothetical protein
MPQRRRKPAPRPKQPARVRKAKTKKRRRRRGENTQRHPELWGLALVVVCIQTNLMRALCHARSDEMLLSSFLDSLVQGAVLEILRLEHSVYSARGQHE